MHRLSSPDPNVTAILDSIKSKLYLGGDDSITSLSTECELEIFRNYADEIKPSIFVNTDIGRVIDDHIRVLSYYQESFLLSRSEPVDGTSTVNKSSLTTGEKLLWKLFFNQEPVKTNLSNFFEINYHQEIFGVSVGSDQDRVFFGNNDYYFLKSWSISWKSFGVKSFDVYCKIDGGAEVLWKSGLTSKNSVFTFIPSLVTMTSIQFVIKSHEDPTIYCQSKVFSPTMAFDGNELSAPKTTSVKTLVEFEIDPNDPKVLEIVNANLDSSWFNGNDNYSLTISKELLDSRGVEFNDYVDKTLEFTTYDNFRMVYSSVIQDSLSDPNVVTLKFNRQVRSNILPDLIYSSSDDGVDYNQMEIERLRIIDDSIVIELNPINTQFKYYRLEIGLIYDTLGYSTLAQETIDFQNNHGLVYAGNDLVISDDGKIVNIGDYVTVGYF